MLPETIDLLLTAALVTLLVGLGGAALWALPWRDEEVAQADRAARRLAARAARRAARVGDVTAAALVR